MGNKMLAPAMQSVAVEHIQSINLERYRSCFFDIQQSDTNVILKQKNLIIQSKNRKSVSSDQ